MQPKWLAKSATAIALVAVMRLKPSIRSGLRRSAGHIRNEYTQILNYLQLIGSSKSR